MSVMSSRSKATAFPMSREGDPSVSGLDWSASPLGSPDTWPGSLRTVANLVLVSKLPMFVAWGPELALVYNEAYASMLGSRHPGAMGRRLQDVHADSWEGIGPLVDRAMAGEAVLQEGSDAHPCLTVSYSPVLDENGTVGGVFCTCTDLTRWAMAERDLREVQGRRTFLLRLGEQLRPLSEASEIEEVAAEMLGRQLQAERCGYAEIDETGAFFIIEREWAGAAIPSLVGGHRLDGLGSLLPDLQAGRSVRLDEGLVQPAAGSSGPVIAVPLLRGGHLAALLYIQPAAPERWNEDMDVFAREVVERAWDAVERARKEAALREGEARQSFLLKLVDHLRDLTDPREVMVVASEAVARHLGANRVGYNEFDPDGDSLVVTSEWQDGGMPTVIGRHRLSDFTPKLMDRYRAGETVALDDLEQSAPVAGEIALQAHARIGVAAQICAPLVKDGRMVALLFVHSRTKRHWTEGEVALARDAVERTWDNVRRAHAERALRESEDHYRHAVELNPQVPWTADPAGTLLTISPRWTELTGQTVDVTLKEGWVAVIDPDGRERSVAAWREAVQSGESLDIEVRVETPNGSYRWLRIRAHPRMEGGSVVRWYGIAEDTHQRKLAEEQLKLLVNELNHRVKNTLATVQSIAAQTLRTTPVAAQAREDFESRLLALSRVHDVLTRENWEGAGLRDLVSQAVEPYRKDGEDRLKIVGAEVRLPPRMALALALALQELTTNAVKYGALSNATGKVEIGWRVEGTPSEGRLLFRWEESGGPPVQPPLRRGFGSRLLERSLAYDLDGRAQIAFDPAGVVCTVDAPWHRP